MKHAVMMVREKEIDEVVLSLPRKECQALIDAVEAASKAQPRKTSWKKLLRELEEVACWTWSRET